MKNIKYINSALLVALLLSTGNNFAIGWGINNLKQGLHGAWNMVVPRVKPVKKGVFAGLEYISSKIPACNSAQLVEIAKKHPYPYIITGAVIVGAGTYALYRGVKHLYFNAGDKKVLDQEKMIASEEHSDLRPHQPDVAPDVANVESEDNSVLEGDQYLPEKHESLPAEEASSCVAIAEECDNQLAEQEGLPVADANIEIENNSEGDQQLPEEPAQESDCVSVSESTQAPKHEISPEEYITNVIDAVNFDNAATSSVMTGEADPILKTRKSDVSVLVDDAHKDWMPLLRAYAEQYQTLMEYEIPESEWKAAFAELLKRSDNIKLYAQQLREAQDPVTATSMHQQRVYRGGCSSCRR